MVSEETVRTGIAIESTIRGCRQKRPYVTVHDRRGNRNRSERSELRISQGLADRRCSRGQPTNGMEAFDVLGDGRSKVARGPKRITHLERTHRQVEGRNHVTASNMLPMDLRSHSADRDERTDSPNTRPHHHNEGQGQPKHRCLRKWQYRLRKRENSQQQHKHLLRGNHTPHYKPNCQYCCLPRRPSLRLRYRVIHPHNSFRRPALAVLRQGCRPMAPPRSVRRIRWQTIRGQP